MAGRNLLLGSVDSELVGVGFAGLVRCHLQHLLVLVGGFETQARTVVESGVVGDAKEPRSKSGIPSKLIQPLVDLDEDVLDQLFGFALTTRSQDGEDQSEDRSSGGARRAR